LPFAFFFAAFRPVEDDPHDEVFGEVLEAVDDAGGHEEEVAGGERVSLLAVDELAAALGDDVSLVARVRLLRVSPARRVNLDREAAALKHFREALAARAGQTRQGFRDAYPPPRGVRRGVRLRRGLLRHLFRPGVSQKRNFPSQTISASFFRGLGASRSRKLSGRSSALPGLPTAAIASTRKPSGMPSSVRARS
jgi:hypothetical protein